MTSNAFPVSAPLPAHMTEEQTFCRIAGCRVIAQMLGAFINEKLLPESAVAIAADGSRVFVTLDITPERLAYRAAAHRTFAYSRLLFEYAPIIRIADGYESACADPLVLVDDLAPLLPGSPETKARLREEIRQTWQNHAQALAEGGHRTFRLAELPYEEAESFLTNGHPYHPCFKSRIGFSAEDNRSYGPEFGKTIHPVWLAIHKTLATSEAMACGTGQDSALLEASIDEHSRKLFEEEIARHVSRPEDFYWLPVHPWQWENVLEEATAIYRQTRKIIHLGWSRHEYGAQQSIRTLHSLSDRTAPSLKLSLSILNTSNKRTLASHTVINAPRISSWLNDIAEEDAFLKDAGTVFLLERMGSSAVFPDGGQSDRLRGALAAIWRDPIGKFLAEGEAATPFALLTQLDHDGAPAIAGWISHHGLIPWVQGLLTAAMLPVAHLLLARGIALESHQQNMVLIHRDGLPIRIALKDFHDGVRFIPRWLNAPKPRLAPTPEEHAKVNPNSYVEATDAEDVRDFMFDALFGVNLAELGWFLERDFDFPERHFWQLTRQTLDLYLERVPEAREGIERYRFLGETVAVEALASRRLKNGAVPCRIVANPLTMPLDQDCPAAAKDAPV